MNFKKFFLMLLISLLIIPTNILAYSNKLIVGGSNIGIEVKTKGILVIGQYKIDNEFINSSSGIKNGDYITKVLGNTVNNISDFTREINNNSNKNQIEIEYLRENKTYKTNLNIVNQNGEYKTGLYVKDSISGIGTLTFIDPETKKFGALGHEIQDKNTNEVLNIDTGTIFSSNVTGVNKSSSGVPGEKQATYDLSKVYGTITSNTVKGLFGSYTGKLDDSDLYDVASIEDIKEGLATILTVTEGEIISSYTINIDSLNTKDETKNIVFTITDKDLLSKTGGIVQGMSGSPIIQDGKIIGAVTHVIVNDCTKGYGIFITNMLEEAEK